MIYLSCHETVFFYLKVFRSCIVWPSSADRSCMQEHITVSHAYKQIHSWLLYVLMKSLRASPRRPVSVWILSITEQRCLVPFILTIFWSQVSFKGEKRHVQPWLFCLNQVCGVVQMWAVWAEVAFLWCWTQLYRPPPDISPHFLWDYSICLFKDC